MRGKFDDYLKKLQAMPPSELRRNLVWLKQNWGQLKDWINMDLLSQDVRIQDVFFELAELEDATSALQETEEGRSGSAPVPRLREADREGPS